MTWERVVLLGEDMAHRGFLVRLCREVGWRVALEDIAPRGTGSGSDYVIHRFPEHLQGVRAGYPRLGLLVAIDGDDRGRDRRLAALRHQCEEQGLEPRGNLDAVAILVPVWSVDTWALFFSRGVVVRENEKAKGKARSMFGPAHRGFLAPGTPVEDAPRPWKERPLAALAEGFLSDRSHPDLPSIDLSRADFRRWR